MNLASGEGSVTISLRFLLPCLSHLQGLYPLQAQTNPSSLLLLLVRESVTEVTHAPSTIHTR